VTCRSIVVSTPDATVRVRVRRPALQERAALAVHGRTDHDAVVGDFTAQRLGRDRGRAAGGRNRAEALRAGVGPRLLTGHQRPRDGRVVAPHLCARETAAVRVGGLASRAGRADRAAHMIRPHADLEFVRPAAEARELHAGRVGVGRPGRAEVVVVAEVGEAGERGRGREGEDGEKKDGAWVSHVTLVDPRRRRIHG
jgi:hypothetical protein